jgi:hypothetical protein
MGCQFSRPHTNEDETALLSVADITQCTEFDPTVVHALVRTWTAILEYAHRDTVEDSVTTTTRHGDARDQLDGYDTTGSGHANATIAGTTTTESAALGTPHGTASTTRSTESTGPTSRSGKANRTGPPSTTGVEGTGTASRNGKASHASATATTTDESAKAANRSGQAGYATEDTFEGPRAIHRPGAGTSQTSPRHKSLGLREALLPTTPAY